MYITSKFYKFQYSSTTWIYEMTQSYFFFQMKLYNSSFPASEHVLYMGWVCEGILNHNLPWQNWKPKFIALKGTDIYMFDTPPVSVDERLFMYLALS